MAYLDLKLPPVETVMFPVHATIFIHLQLCSFYIQLHNLFMGGKMEKASLRSFTTTTVGEERRGGNKSNFINEIYKKSSVLKGYLLII